MNCPKCKTVKLKPSFLEPALRSHECVHCDGDWILIEDIVSWLEQTKPMFSGDESAVFLEDDSKTALICPLTGQLMQKYRINNDTDHKLDYSANVGGVWLDAGEWSYLKDQGIALQVGKIFTDAWQKQIRDNDTKAMYQALYESKFGDDYEKLKEIKSWLDSNGNKTELRRYLLAENPYGI
ncbi:MAG: zf-TFIIB domain-containing protein [Pontibacterium sp.]